jgi:hypothetical protein
VILMAGKPSVALVYGEGPWLHYNLARKQKGKKYVQKRSQGPDTSGSCL